MSPIGTQRALQVAEGAVVALAAIRGSANQLAAMVRQRYERSVILLDNSSEAAASGCSPTQGRLERLGRSLAELLSMVAMLQERGVALLSLEETIDTPAAGELIFHVFGAMAHFGRRLIGERTKDRIATAR